MVPADMAPARSTSVVIPVYNDFAGVERCLKALLAQTYPPDAFEVIIVDNGSSPPLQIEHDGPFSVRVIRCDTPGSYAARNAGASIAEGGILAFLDADCWPNSDWLANGVAALTIRDDKVIIGGEVTLVMPDRRSATALYQYATGFGQESNVRDRGFAATANLFCTRRQFDVAGPFDERLLSGGDAQWCWRAAEKQLPTVFEPHVVVYTTPRASLGAAIRQARRVTAGRRALRRPDIAPCTRAGATRRRTPWQAAAWVWQTDRIAGWDRVRVFGVAMLIRLATMLETARLTLGRAAERR